MEAAGGRGGRGRLELEAEAAAALFEHEVELDPRGGAEVTGPPAGMGVEDLLECEALPRGPEDRVPTEILFRFQSQQGVQQPAVTEVDFGALDEALLQVPSSPASRCAKVVLPHCRGPVRTTPAT